MDQSSSFFNCCEELASDTPSGLRKIYASQSGYSEISTGVIDGKRVALKSLKAEYRGHPFYEGILRKEYEIGRSLDHPNICRSLDFITLPRQGGCIVLQWVEGVSLQTLLDRGAKLPARKMIMQLCDALEYIHCRQIIHRDLKPGNILITSNSQNVKLIDFGLSDTDDYVRFKNPAGTLDYASPEQKRGETLDGRSDIYSLGRIMQTLGAYPRIAEICAREDREERFADITEVRAALQRRYRIRKIIIAAVLSLIVACGIAFHALLPDIRKAHGRRATDAVFEQISGEIRDAGY